MKPRIELVRWAAGAGRGADDVREQSGANSGNAEPSYGDGGKK